MEDSQVTGELTEKIEELVRQTNAIADPAARSLAVELVSSVMDLHGAALGRIVELAQSARDGRTLIDAMTRDEFVSAVLALHSVHPESLDARLTRSLERLRKQLAAGEMEFVIEGVTPERVTIRLSGGQPAQRAAARHWIESAIYEAGPEVGEVVIEGAEEKTTGFVPLESLLTSREAV
jgi:hypothetical protein